MPAPEKPIKRLTLRELLTDSEKRARQLAEHLQSAWITRAIDVRELSRTVRRRSHFPTVTALHNSVQKLLELSRETEGQMDFLVQELEAIREHARRERSQRV
jgi:C4-dicarboxylate-specific signal transduction histidine kinase